MYLKDTGAQEWHIVSLLGDVTSPTTAVHYVSMTSNLRVLSTENHWPMRRQHTMYTNNSSQCKGEVHSSPLNKYGGFVMSQQRMGDLKRFPSVSWFSHPCCRGRLRRAAHGKNHYGGRAYLVFIGSLAPPVSFHSESMWLRSLRQSERTTGRDPAQQKMILSVLQGGQYGTSTKMDALMVYDAFQTFGKR